MQKKDEREIPHLLISVRYKVSSNLFSGYKIKFEWVHKKKYVHDFPN